MSFPTLFDDKPLTVSEITSRARGLIEGEFPDVAVIGEISNLKRHTSGHLYFTLKDDAAQLSVACFRRDVTRLACDPKDGLKVVARGRLTIYEARGQFQLVAHAIEEVGAGELEKAFRELCAKLEKEGLFDDVHKKPLPPYPFRIAVVTSPTGAAIRDIVSTLTRRWPCVEILIVPVHVQGAQAAPEIVDALERLPRVPEIDLIILGRGGGSLEDLWAFNEEAVGRAIHACPIPIVSAVGHQTDFTISDFVADVRAATPTMAAEIAVPRIDEVLAALDDRRGRLIKSIRVKLELWTGRVEALVRSYALGRVKGRIENAMQTLDYSFESLVRAIRDAIRHRTSTLDQWTTRLAGLDARAVLSRGYSICADLETGRILGSADAALEAGEMQVMFVDGRIHATAKEKLNGKGQ